MRGSILTLLFLILSLQSAGGEEIRIVPAVGQGLIVDGNIAAAREGAIQDGLRKVVKKVLVERVGEEVFVANLPLFVERFLSRPMEFMESYRIVDEQEGEGIYRVYLEASLLIRLVDRGISNLGLLFGEGIKVLLMVTERDLARLPVYWWSGLENGMGRMEMVIGEVLLEAGLLVIDPFLGPVEDIPLDMRVPYLSRKEIERFGELFGADLVVYGELTVEERDFPLSLFGRRGKVGLKIRVFSMEEGRDLIGYRSSLLIPDISNFSLEGSPLIYDRLTWSLHRDLIVPLIKELKKEERGVIRITFSGIGSYREYRVIRELLETLDGIDRVEVRRFSKGTFTLIVEARIGAATLTERLQEVEWEGFVLRPLRITGREVGFQIIQEGP